jgi:hypothetical protein
MQCLTSIRHAERAWATVWQVKVLQAADFTQNTATGAHSNKMKATARHATTLGVHHSAVGVQPDLLYTSVMMTHLVIERAAVDGLAASAVARCEVATLQ